jgi:hypothetical protein
MGRQDREGLSRKFESGDVLQELLELAGSPYSVEQVIERFNEAKAHGESSSEVVPSLFEAEPRFPNPEYAKKLFSNLLGLWDLVQSGAPIRLEKVERPPRVKKEKPNAPGPFGASGPDQAFVVAGLSYLGSLDNRERDRLQHAFDNRQDAVVGFLDEQELSDEAFHLARKVLFELFSLIELGWPSGTRPVRREELEPPSVSPGEVPLALAAYADEAISKAGPDEGGRVRSAVQRGLLALWKARKA